MDIVRDRGLLHEADLLVASHGGRLSPATGREVLESVPLFARALLRGKVTVEAVAGHPHRALAGVRRIVDLVEGRPRRVEVRLRSGRVWETAEEQGVDSGSGSAGAPPPSRHV